jgi:hypothetical protein
VSGAGQNRDGSQIRVMGTRLVTRCVQVRETADGGEIFGANRSDDEDRYGPVNLWKWCRNRQVWSLEVTVRE